VVFDIATSHSIRPASNVILVAGYHELPSLDSRYNLAPIDTTST